MKPVTIPTFEEFKARAIAAYGNDEKALRIAYDNYVHALQQRNNYALSERSTA